MPHDFQADITAVQSIDAVPRILEVICRTTGMGFAAVARVTEDRWVCCAVRDEIEFGLMPGGELRVETTICDEIRQRGESVVIDHVAEDRAYCGHPTPAMYGFESYISIPIVLANGTFFGTLCAIDPRPARLSAPETVGMFKLFSELISTQLDSVRKLAESEAKLLDAHQTAELREQFIAVLGHDLRNPLSSIDAGLRLVQKAGSLERSSELFRLMHNSVKRMTNLVDNLLDFARGRLGGGVGVNRSVQSLEPVLKQVLEELRVSFPDKTIEQDISLAEPVYCDGARIAQLFSNLLGNALTHGAVDKLIKVKAMTENDDFEMTVVNFGTPIPPAALENLFKPFYRGALTPSLQGLGLGLYISSEIAHAHGGTITVASSAEETRFTFRMPIR
jgi:signal transduction histidine kinase